MKQRDSINSLLKGKSLDINDIIQKILNAVVSSNNQFVLSEAEIIGLCYESKSIFMKQPMLLQINPPINICGDFHGQFVDLKEVFKAVGVPKPGTHYLFLGDYVDRGRQSLQCICLLLAYKIKYPGLVFMLRGNHECSQLNKIYGFYDECKRRVGIKIWKAFCDCFNCFPIAAVVGNRIFCVHGGLSPMMSRLSEINLIKRPLDLIRNTIFCDILWSDPSTSPGWQDNIERGVSYTFGPDILNKFLQINDFDLLCRSHQVAEDGYQFFNERKLITIFSAPNYCSLYQNMGAVLIIDKDMGCRIKQFQNQIGVKKSMRSKRENTPVPRNNLQLKQNSEQQNQLKISTLIQRKKKRESTPIKNNSSTFYPTVFKRDSLFAQRRN